jgi:ribonuclease VapC
MCALPIRIARTNRWRVLTEALSRRGTREAPRTFGKGNHLASLNFGDCFANALAKERGLAPLFKGEDFARMDLGLAL